MQQRVAAPPCNTISFYTTRGTSSKWSKGEAKTLGLEINQIIKQIVKVGDGDGTSPLSSHLKSATGLATIDCNTQELDNNNTNNKKLKIHA